MWIIVILGFALFMFCGCVISFVAGRARGFEDCWRQYVKDYWERKEQRL
jgi:hypothetical protein